MHEIGQAVLSAGLSLFRRLGVPVAGDVIIPGHALTDLMHIAVEELSSGMAALGLLAVPPHGLIERYRRWRTGDRRTIKTKGYKR
jgi:hypothetical protein